MTDKELKQSLDDDLRNPDWKQNHKFSAWIVCESLGFFVALCVMSLAYTGASYGAFTRVLLFSGITHIASWTLYLINPKFIRII